MSKSVAFLSGKGGSGKTTLALSIADLLSRCNITTLLVDCDLSTNGATYFYESCLSDDKYHHYYPISNEYDRLFNGIYVYDNKLPNSNSQTKLNSFSDLLECKSGTVFPLQIKKNLFFLPSVTKLSDQEETKTQKLSPDSIERKLDYFIKGSDFYFDVILFDCQAGYTDLLPSLLPKMDTNLFILEADSVSGSAMRNFHLKTGKYLGKSKLYQVFNKVTEEEYEIYSKITGTFFINIGTILFDGKIRQAFSRLQIPDLENVSARFGSDICDICKLIFREAELNNKLNDFSIDIKIQKIQEEKKEIELQLADMPSKSSNANKLITYTSAFLYFLLILFVLSISIWRKDIILSSDELLSMCIIACIIGIETIIMFNLPDIRGKQKQRQKYRARIKELSSEEIALREKKNKLAR